MNKTEFIHAVAANAGLSKADGKKVVEAVLKTISDEMKKGGKIAIPGFGSFSITEKAERPGINPRTKQVIKIPAHKVVKFKAGVDLAKVVQ
ncbi:MAG: HU family DNA-binding protein [Tannerella sp.]|jgi:DNA-binding protein HU-beta|nr:HU family DNA-binding protein [Tannerella sp.]